MNPPFNLYDSNKQSFEVTNWGNLPGPAGNSTLFPSLHAAETGGPVPAGVYSANITFTAPFYKVMDIDTPNFYIVKKIEDSDA